MIRMALMMRDVVLRFAQRSLIYEPGRRRAFAPLLKIALFAGFVEQVGTKADGASSTAIETEECVAAHTCNWGEGEEVYNQRAW
jgi:hypothetical protein